MSRGNSGKSSKSWMNDWRVHAASGAVLMLLVVTVLANKQLGVKNRRAAKPMNPTHGSRLDGEFKPLSRDTAPTAQPTENSGLGNIQRTPNLPRGSGMSVDIQLETDWLQELPVVSPHPSGNVEPTVDPLYLLAGHAIALTIDLPTPDAPADKIEFKIGSNAIRIQPIDGHVQFACRGQSLGKIPIPGEDGRVQVCIFREPVDGAESRSDVLRWVLATHGKAVAGRVQLGNLGDQPLIEMLSPADGAQSLTIEGLRWGTMLSVPTVDIKPVRFSQ